MKAESRSQSHHEEVRDEAVLAHTAESDTHFYGVLDFHLNPPNMALCQLED